MKIYTLIFVLSLILSGVYAQTNQNKDRVNAAKVEFFTEKLELSTSEAEKFWPIFNDYQNRKRKLSQERKNLMLFYRENKSNMTPEEISESLDRYISIEQEETDLLTRYNEKFKQVLAKEKVLKIYITEVQFRNYLLKQLKARQSGTNSRN